MDQVKLTQDPYNVIITGVGGQGNVLASKLLGNILTEKGLEITIGETFGATQRGGSVMSHLRISHECCWSPQTPGGKAHIVVALEPMEALRVIAAYGNPETLVITNDRPVYPVSVISGEMKYPAREDISRWLGEYSGRSYMLPASREAIRLGAPILANIILLGALAGCGELPFGQKDFSRAIGLMMPSAKVGVNLEAFEAGFKMTAP